jgi:hypothetical protein
MRPKTVSHPAERFAAPGTIQHGVPLKNLIGREMIELLAESMEAVAGAACDSAAGQEGGEAGGDAEEVMSVNLRYTE